MTMTPAHLFATVGGVGHLKPAPGTWGSLAAFPLGYGLFALGGLWLFLCALALTFFLGVRATERVTQDSGTHDPSEVVIDEVVGQWIALVPVVVGAAHAGLSPLALWPGLLAAFVLFRLFDITKPGLVGRMDRRADALGVMLDDVVAGVFAALGVSALGALAHVVLMA